MQQANYLQEAVNQPNYLAQIEVLKRAIRDDRIMIKALSRELNTIKKKIGGGSD